jgi:superfamily I DNA and/or RNA helicase
LADPRQQSRLPSHYRPRGVAGGYVNYVEAQAVVRYVETFLADIRKLGALASETGNGRRPIAAVTALYAEQVQLIRTLVLQNGQLDGWESLFAIVPPDCLAEQDFAMMIVSMTRSHLHRAVSFGEHPGTLRSAMTRARSHLVVFGDPGTILRRAQWTGPLEQLEQATAERERRLMARLAEYIQGIGRPAAFQLREGTAT